MLVVAGTAVIASAEMINDGLIAYWQFDELDGTIADNEVSTSSNFDGILMGDTTFVAGKFGNAVTFDGSGDYVDVANVLIPAASQSYSVATWFKATESSLDGTRRMLFETSGDWAASVELSATANLLKYSVNTEGTTGDAIVSTTIKPSEGEWHHVVLTYDSVTDPVSGDVTGTSKIFYDGAEVVAARRTTSNTLRPSTGFHIGTYRDANGRYFEGLLDDMGVWNRSLDDSEVAWLWNEGVGNAVASAVPEPGMCTLLLTVFWGAFTFRKRRRQH